MNTGKSAKLGKHMNNSKVVCKKTGIYSQYDTKHHPQNTILQLRSIEVR